MIINFKKVIPVLKIRKYLIKQWWLCLSIMELGLQEVTVYTKVINSVLTELAWLLKEELLIVSLKHVNLETWNMVLPPTVVNIDLVL